MSGSYNRKDHWHQKAKEEGLRSRAAYKILEIQNKFKILRKGDAVLELGCWPGGWLQSLAGIVGPKGLVWGVDLKELEDLKLANVFSMVGDICDPGLLEQLREASPGGFHVVVSDMSPKLSGVKEVDNAGSLELAEAAFAATCELVKPGGSFVVKLFKSQPAQLFAKEVGRHFNTTKLSELETTRKSSTEYYLVAKGYKALGSTVASSSTDN